MRNIIEQGIKVKQASIKDVCQTIIAPLKIQKSEFSTDGKFPIIDQSTNLVAGYTNNKEAIISNGEYVIFGDHTRIIKFVDYPFAQGADGIKILKAKNNVLPKYLFYSICNLNIPNKGYSRHWGLVSNLTINLPLPKVQEEIVEILDSFTNLIDALNEELSLRQKQFEYYREKLLTFDDTSLLKSINEIGTLYRGNGLQKKDFVEEGIGCIHYGQIYTKLGFSLSKPLTYVTKETAKPLTKVRKGDLVIACTSENVEDVCKSVVWEGEEEIVTGGHACVFRHNENPRYIGYFFQTYQFFMQKKQYAYGVKVIDIKTEKLGEILIPIPSLAIQQSIVEKLDSFESLISYLKEEIALRQKQYEYYREKLLTFD